MILGIDVGGTHADGVLLQNNQVVARKKVVIDKDNLTDSIISLLAFLIPPEKSEIVRIHLSTTLCTNALVNGKLGSVGMFIQAGPGMNPEFLQCGDENCFLDGVIDHRGQVIKNPTDGLVKKTMKVWQAKGIDSVGIVTKFSQRNNTHELLVKKQVEGFCKHVSVGHILSGMPNFPRRVYTTWLNAALVDEFSLFRDAIEKGLRVFGVSCPLHVLKADGGTMPFQAGCNFPCQSIHSGPSASVMGALALIEDIGKDSLLLDIGGTTTDIALFVDGSPLLEPYGATVAGRPTLIRSLMTKSVGLGGDSVVSCKDGQYSIGPHREGAPMAFGGLCPTPTDALIVLGKISAGSYEKAAEAMMILDNRNDSKETARAVIDQFSTDISGHISEMIEEVFSRPVYTVSAFLQRRKIEPKQIILIGGPAAALAESIQEKSKVACLVPEHSDVANAIGAARARVTLEASLYADTSTGKLSIPEISLFAKTGRMFTMTDAEEHLEKAIGILGESIGLQEIPDLDFIERLEMNTVKGFSSTGKIIALKAQIRPGLEPLEG